MTKLCIVSLAERQPCGKNVNPCWRRLLCPATPRPASLKLTPMSPLQQTYLQTLKSNISIIIETIESKALKISCQKSKNANRDKKQTLNSAKKSYVNFQELRTWLCLKKNIFQKMWQLTDECTAISLLTKKDIVLLAT